MTMVPAPKLSKPHLVFYGACGGGSGAASEVMSRFGGGGGGGVVGNNNASPTTADNIIINTTTTITADADDAFINGGNINNKAGDEDDDTNNNNNNNNFIRCVLGSDLAIRHPNNNNIDEQQQQQQSRHSNNNSSVNNDDDEGSVDVHLQPATSIKITDTLMIDSNSWLQLGLGSGGFGVGGGSGGSGFHLDTPLQPLQHHQQRPQPESTAVSGGLMLDLNLGGSGGHKTTPFLAPEVRSVTGPTTTAATTTFISPNHHHHHQLISSQLYFLQQQQQIAGCWGFNNQRTTAGLNSTGCCSSPSSSSSFQQPVFVQSGGAPAPFLTRPFTPSMDTPDSEFRLIQPPPRRPHSGIWFALYASLHQSKEPFLPQLPKHFLRIKDGGMTVRLVMKYVANKLGLDCESEVEIKCRGQQLVPNLTLQHVRDNIWSPREAHVTVTLLPESSTSDHVMVLHYGRTLPYSPYLTY